VYLLPTEGGSPTKLCDECGAPRTWSPDQHTLICQTGGRLYRLIAVDIASRKSTDFLRHSAASLYAPQFSADGRWIAFGARFKPNDERLFVAPVTNGVVPQEQAGWVPIASGPALDNKPRWSPNGNLLYFTSDRDGFTCVWAQHLNPATKRPAGPAFPVLHLHGAVRSLAYSGSVKLEISVASDSLAFHLDENRGNIWMIKLPPR